MSLTVVSIREKLFEEPSSKTLNVGAPTWISSAEGSIAVAKPSEITLNVGAPTFSPSSTCRGGFTPPSSLPIVAELHMGRLYSPFRGLAGLKPGLYKNLASRLPVVAR